MRLRTWYKVHKWVSIAMAAALLVWTFTGLVMVLPPSDLAQRAEPAAIAFDRMTLPPSEAARLAAAHWGDSTAVRELALRPVLGRLAYWALPVRGRYLLLDAETGQPFTITDSLALEVARAAVGRPAGVARAERITRYTVDYPAGPLPIVRVEFAGGVVVHVSQRDGAVTTRSLPSDRFKTTNHLLHSFLQLRVGPGGSVTQHAAIWFFGVGSLVTIITGLYLSLPKRLKVRARAGARTGAVQSDQRNE